MHYMILDVLRLVRSPLSSPNVTGFHHRRFLSLCNLAVCLTVCQLNRGSFSIAVHHLPTNYRGKGE